MSALDHHTPAPGLPDPYYQREFYADVPTKRAIAWAVDIALIGALSLLVVVFTAFIGLFFFGLIFAGIGFVYRVTSLATRSATPGMRMAAIELRSGSGERLDPAQAFLHTLGYYVSMGTFVLQIGSIILMLTTPRGQGLSDMVLGTVALNRRARA